MAVQGLIAGIFSSKTFTFLFPEVVGFFTWWFSVWQPVFSYRASSGTLTMPWGPSLTTTLCGSSLGGSQNSTTFLRDTQWRSERVTHFGRVSSIFDLWVWLSGPHILMSLEVNMPHKCSQVHFPFSAPHLILPVALGGFLARNYLSSSFCIRRLTPRTLKWNA